MTSMTDIKRKKHTGEPGNGGQFAADQKPEANVNLETSDPTPWLNPATGERRADAVADSAFILSPRPASAGDPFILLVGGLVQNDPGIDVLDIDFLDAGSDDRLSHEEAFAVREAAANHGRADIVTEITDWLISNGALTEDDKIRVAVPGDDNFILLDGGLIQNSPPRDIIDLDFLKGGGSEDDVDYARDMQELTVKHGLTEETARIDRFLEWAAED